MAPLTTPPAAASPAREAGLGIWGAAIYGAQIVANSLAGYLFARTLAHYLGAGAEKSAFDIAWSLPFLVLNLAGFNFMYGLAAASFAKWGPKEQAQRQRLFSAVLGLVLLSGFVLCLAGWLLAGPMSRWLAPGLGSNWQAQIADMVRIMLPLSLVLGVSVFTGGVAAAVRMPLTSELSLLLARVCFVAWAVWAGGFTLMSAAWALLLSGVGAAVVQALWFQAGSGFSLRPSLDLRAPGLAGIMGKAAGLLVSAALAQVAFAYMRRLGTLEGPGTVAALTYAGAILNALDMLMGKTLSFITGARYVQGDRAGKSRVLRRGLWGAMALSVPAAILVTIFMEPLVELLFGTGAFGDQAVRAVSALGRPLIWTLPFSVAMWVVLVPLLSRSSPWLGPSVYGAGYVLRLFIYHFGFPLWGASALAWGWTISAAATAGLGLLALRGAGGRLRP